MSHHSDTRGAGARRRSFRDSPIYAYASGIGAASPSRLLPKTISSEAESNVVDRDDLMPVVGRAHRRRPLSAQRRSATNGRRAPDGRES